MSWAEHSERVLQALFQSLPLSTGDGELKRLLFDAYPFGERKYWPYKVWLQKAREYRIRFENRQRRAGLRDPLPLPVDGLFNQKGNE